MAFQISFTIQGEKQLSRRLEIMTDGIKDFSDPFKKTAEYLVDAFKQSFDYQGSNIGVAWPPLKDSTLKQKAKNYPGAPMLVRTGAMKGAFQQSYSTDYAKVWNSVMGDYFKYHQSNEPRSKIPRRQMMALNDNIKENIVKFFHEYIHKITNANG